MIKRKLLLTAVMLFGTGALFVVSIYFGYRAVTAPGDLYGIGAGVGRGMGSTEQQFALWSLIGAIAIVAFVRRYWRTRGGGRSSERRGS